MYAIIDFGGHQYKVEKDRYLYVNRLKEEVGNELSIDQVLMVNDNGNVSVGTPTVAGAQVKAEVQEHLRDDKITVFKKKRRKGYQKKKGHRQDLTKVLVKDIVTG